MSNELTVRNQSGVLARVGNPEERQYLMQIMAEQIGIPARDAGRTDVVALLGLAVQRTIQYGWIPGIHLHVQKFETERSRKARENNASLEPIYSYTLVDGEKAYKDSGTRWRDRGVQWRYQRKPMTPQEVKEEARLQGYNEALAANAYGMWSRIIIAGQDDPQDDDNPLWSAGLFTGKIKAGNYWRADVIPTGVSSRDIAIRRADKRAMMQSTLTLLPIDDLGADARIRHLVDSLRQEASIREREQAPMLRLDKVEVEEDGNALWVSTPSSDARPGGFGPGPSSGARPARIVDADGVILEGEYVAEPSEEDDAPLVEELDARPEPPGARPVNRADGPCPVCHAPVGKPHATSCTEAGYIPDARPEEPSARPAASTAKKQEQTPLDFGGSLYEALATLSNDPLSPEIAELIRKTRNADKDSAMKMNETYYKALSLLLKTEIGADKDEIDMLFTALLGYRVSAKVRPGQLVHGFMVKPLRDRDEKWLRPLRGLLEICCGIAIAAVEGNGPQG